MSLPLPAVSLKVMPSTINNTHTRTEKRPFTLHSLVIQTQRDCSWSHTPLLLNHPTIFSRVCSGLVIKTKHIILGTTEFRSFNHT